MKLSWSMISLISRFAAVGIGILQSIIIVKLLNVEEYGILGIIGGIGATIGVYQNLGISSASTREISAAKTKGEAFKVFIGSLIVRYMISVPLVLLLFFFAGSISKEVNNRPEMVFPLRLFAVTLLIQSLQSVLNSVIQGLKAFKFLFIFQVAIAVMSIVLYVPLIYAFNLIGYYYAFLLLNLISTIVLFAYSMKLFGGEIAFPGKKELIKIVKAVFSIGLFVYIIRIMDTQWQELGPVILGLKLDNYTIGIFSFALLVSSKIITISDAITDVTLPSMTSIYENSREKFREVFTKGNTSAHILIMMAVVFFIIFKVDMFRVVDMVFIFAGKNSIIEKYGSAFSLMDPLVIAFWGYSHMNLLRSGYSVPTKKLKGAVYAHIVLFLLTIGLYKFPIYDLGPLHNFLVGMSVSGVVSYLFMLLYAKYESGYWLISKIDIVHFLISVVALGLYYAYPVFPFSYIIAVVYILISIYVYRTNKTEG